MTIYWVLYLSVKSPCLLPACRLVHSYEVLSFGMEWPNLHNPLFAQFVPVHITFCPSPLECSRHK